MHLKNNKLNLKRTSYFLLFMFVMQPILDVLTYWLIELGKGTVITFVIRTLIFFVTMLIGFLLSKQRKVYYWVFSIVLIFWLARYVNSYRIGHSAILYDLRVYFRLVQAPMFIIAFISIFRQYEFKLLPVKKYILVNYLIILSVILLAAITGTQGYTYGKWHRVGIKGWFYNGNAQTAIVAMIVPVVLYVAYESRKKIIFLLSALLCFAHLFYTGTKVAYYSIFIISFCFVLSLWLTKSRSVFHYVVIITLAVLCVAFVTYSPMSKMSSIHNEYIFNKKELVKEQITSPSSSGPQQSYSKESNNSGAKKQAKDQFKSNQLSEGKLQKYQQLYMGLSRYHPMINKFGLEAVVARTNYITDIETLSNARYMKIVYNLLLWNEQDIVTKLFGVHYDMQICGEENYDVENDMLGVLFLYGYLGFTIYLLFMGYFVFIVLRSLILHFKSVFSMELGCIITSLLIAAITTIFTAGMLRSTNASFYLSVFLVCVYFICEVNTNDGIDSRKLSK